jgi:hypothetical protein
MGYIYIYIYGKTIAKRTQYKAKPWRDPIKVKGATYKINLHNLRFSKTI